MTETQKRIKAYQKALPGMKERVTAVALMLVMSVCMLASATMAWVTLSRSPEVSGIATTVTTNGNLEIALSDKDGLQPDETAVGDGGQSVTLSNLTWGNLINLSDESYGLDYLTLRPASLNAANLINSPLYAVDYGEDGRVLGYFTDFAFSNYNDTNKAFMVPTATEYGVRAVSSVTYKEVEGKAFFKSQMDAINESASKAKNLFNEITGNSTYMNAVSALVGVHVSAMFSTDDISCVTYIDTMVEMMGKFQESVDAAGQTMVEIANLHLYIELVNANGGDTVLAGNLYAEQKYDLEDLKENNYSNAFVTKYKGVIAGLYNTSSTEQGYVQLAKKAATAYNGIMKAKEKHQSTGNVYWEADLQSPVNQLCNMSTATLAGMTAAELKSNITTAAQMLLSSNTYPAVINDGALKDLDLMLGQPTLSVKGVTIYVTLPEEYGGINLKTLLMGNLEQDLKVDITTAAAGSEKFILPEAVSDAEETVTVAANGNYKGQAVAADTYAMAVDLWVRTNVDNTLLILEGEYQYREDKVPVYGSNASGMEVPLYTYTKIVDGEEVKWDVYMVETTYYLVSDHTPLTEEQVEGATITAQERIVKTVVGYEGVNRVWDELDDSNSNAAQQIPAGGTSTTQGSGSCYIFYPESPEDQERCLELLASMRVAFVDEKGALLGEADMDTDNAIEDAGRILVPLRMRPQAPIVTGTDSNGDDITTTDYITRLAQNEATRITALVYLDGANLTNSDVLSAGSINGQLNIQFGTSDLEMEPMENKNLMSEYYTLNWNIDGSFKTKYYDATKGSYYFDSYDENICTMPLKLLVEGTQPTSIKGNFISYISATQGAREEVFELTLGKDGFWTAMVPFSGPGNYKLRSLQIDGVDIALDEDQCIAVEIEGIKISSLICQGWTSGDGSTMSLMTAQNVYQQQMIMSLSTNQGAVPSIQGVFLGDNGKTVTANFTKVGDSYMGTANFTSSGTYKLTYVIVDGTYTPVDESMYKTLTIRLGLRANVVISQPVNQAYLDLKEELAAATTEEEKADIQARMVAVLQELHYGTGIEGDENENGLNLQQTNGNWSMVHDGSEKLFMDVSCIIVDDQGSELKNLGNVELFYTAGSETNRLTTGVKWNSATNRYEGTFDLEQNFGVYRFEMVTINGTANTITAANSAPTITSIAPTPMSIVQMSAYEDLVYDLSGTVEREMYITLQNAPAAMLEVTLTKGIGDDAQTITKTIDAYDSETVVGDHTNYTFAIPIDSDGEWALTGVKVCNVFYDNNFYAGGTDVSGWLDLDLDGDKTLDELVKDGETDTCFLTEVTLYANRIPESKTHDFMTSNVCNDMYITVANQGRPLADVLAELAGNEKYSEYDIDPTVSVTMTYTWTEKLSDWTVDDESKLPARNFGGTLTMNTTEGTSYGQYAMGNMNFLVDGKYVADFTLVIGDVTYSSPTALPAGIKTEGKAYQLETPVTVQWNKPDIQVTDVTGAIKNAQNVVTGYESFSVDLSSDSYSESYNPITGVKNYFEPYYANVYIASTARGEHQIPTVTLEVKSGFGSASEATVSASKNSYTFTAGDLDDTQNIGTTSGSWPQVPNRVCAGEQTFTAIAMKSNGATYTLGLKQNVIINQDKLPLYLKYTSDNANVTVPTMVISPDGREYTIDLATVQPWTLRLTDYATSGTPSTSNATVYEYSYAEEKWLFVTYYHYHYKVYNRETTITEALTTTTVDDVTYSVVRWAIGGMEHDAGTQFTISAQHTASSIVGETNRQNVSVTTRNQRTTVVKDTLTNNDYDNGRSQRTSDVVTTVYTSDMYPNGYSYTEDLD